jgi:hypothetical protein
VQLIKQFYTNFSCTINSEADTNFLDHKSEETNKGSADTKEVPSSEKEKTKEEISKEEQSKLNSENKTKKPKIPEVDELEET